MKTHELTTWPRAWDAVWTGEKTFEVRSNLDRDFTEGDTLILRKWDPGARGFADVGRGAYVYGDMVVERAEKASSINATVTYVLHGGRFGLPPGLCVMSIRVNAKDAR